MAIELARIDDRLIHGQVVTTWVKNYDIEQIIIVNDTAANDKVQQSVITMSAPPGIKVVVFGVQKFIEVLKKTEIKRRTMLIFASSSDVLPVVESGQHIDVLNVGGMRMNDKRKSLSRAVAVTPEEEQAFRSLLKLNVKVQIQMVPTDPIVNLETLLN